MGPKRNPNYNNELLLTIIKEVLPAGQNKWEEVATRYHEASMENERRDSESIKRHFNDKLCNGGKKPTGKSGDEKTDLILRAQRIKRAILEHQAVGILGGGVGHSFADDDDENEQDEDDYEDEDQDQDEDNEVDELESSALFGNEFQPTALQTAVSNSGSTSSALIPNGPPAVLNGQGATTSNGTPAVTNSQGGGTKRIAVPGASGNKTKSMKQSARQTAGGHIASLTGALSSVAESNSNAMMMQMMMQMMSQSQQQSNQMMMMIMSQNHMGQQRGGNTFSSPTPALPSNYSPVTFVSFAHQQSSSSTAGSTPALPSNYLPDAFASPANQQEK